jgi:hypothetical protein
MGTILGKGDVGLKPIWGKWTGSGSTYNDDYSDHLHGTDLMDVIYGLGSVDWLYGYGGHDKL